MILAGFVIAFGDVVDDAIIDIENIVRRLRQNRLEGSTGKSTAWVDPRGLAGGPRGDRLRDDDRRWSRSLPVFFIWRA